MRAADLGARPQFGTVDARDDEPACFLIGGPPVDRLGRQLGRAAGKLRGRGPRMERGTRLNGCDRGRKRAPRRRHRQRSHEGPERWISMAWPERPNSVLNWWSRWGSYPGP